MSKYTGTYPSLYRTVDQGQKIGDMANKLAYTGNPKSARWKGGHPTTAYKNAIVKYHSYHKKSKASIAGASCDVFVCTCVRASGVDPNFPQGLWNQEKYLRNTSKFKLVTDGSLQDGDIIIYKRTGAARKGHICIYYKGKIKEANAKMYYGRTVDAVKTRLSKDGKQWVRVYRAVNKQVYTPLKKTSTGTQVKNLQKYLNWYFKDDDDLKALKVDGDFGSITTGRVKLFQRQQKLKVDGIVGKLTVAKMKGVTK